MKYFGSLVLVLLLAGNAMAAEQKKSGSVPADPNRGTAVADRGVSVTTPAAPSLGWKRPAQIQPNLLLIDYLQYRQCVAATGLNYVCAVHFLI